MSWFTSSGSSKTHSSSGRHSTTRYPASSSHHTSSSSYYRRRPRDGYIQNLIRQLRRLLRDLIEYAKRNPMKVFMMFIMPLITGGALTGILKTLGIRLPPGLAGMVGGRSGSSGRAAGLANLAGGLAGGSGGVQGLFKIAQAFM